MRVRLAAGGAVRGITDGFLTSAGFAIGHCTAYLFVGSSFEDGIKTRSSVTSFSLSTLGGWARERLRAIVMLPLMVSY